MESIKKHWETVYKNKGPHQVSWTQSKPHSSLELIGQSKIPKNAPIIDIGGGDSRLVDHLLMEGFTNISVLDISGKALEKARLRLGVLAKEVTWIESDILDFKPTQTYDLWHDRAAFHFLTKTEHIQKYLNLGAEFAVNHMILGTFSTDGPLKCSGLEISQYNSHTLSEIMVGFDRISSKTENHTTPFDTIQNFLFCHFKKA